MKCLLRCMRVSCPAFCLLFVRTVTQNVTLPLWALQEYYETVKAEDAYVPVERNAAGSRPKELFEDVLEEVEAKFEKDRTVLKVGPRAPSLSP